MLLLSLSDFAFRSWKQNPYGAERLDKKHTNDLPSHNLRRNLRDNQSSSSARKSTHIRWENVVNYLLLSFFPSDRSPRDWCDQSFEKRIFPPDVWFLISLRRIWGDNFLLGLHLIFSQFIGYCFSLLNMEILCPGTARKETF